jgi:hypothetical protein
MWRNVCVSVLAALLLLTPTESASLEEYPPGLPHEPPASAVAPTSRHFTYYTELRRGSTELAAIIVSLPEYVTSPRSPVSGVIPLKLELQSSDGVTAKDFNYPATAKRSFSFLPQRVPVIVFTDVLINFRVCADKSAALGPHTMKGKVTFQVISDVGVSSVQQMNIQLALTVVEHDVRVQRTEWSHGQVTATQRTLLIIFEPVIVAAWIAICIPGSILGYCKGS